MRKTEIKELRFAKKRRYFRPDAFQNLISWAFQIGLVCLIAFVCVWYFGRQVSNAGESMSTTLENGEVALVNRVVYNMSIPKRGDVIVFLPNGNENSDYYIRRIIGLPGETVQILEGEIYIDGERLTNQYGGEISNAGLAEEKITLESDEYFVLGDNRESLEDSRQANIGTVKKEDIWGKAWFVITFGEHFGFLH